MKNKLNRFLALLLLPCMLLGTIPVSAASAQEIVIDSKEDWMAFAENARTDAYSAGLTVTLAADIDLTGEKAVSVPIFCGTFQGNNHTISGVKFTTDADHQGLFRVVAKEGKILNLQVEAVLEETDKVSQSGVVVGVNHGLVEGCKASGSLSAYTDIGGIAGINEETGVIRNSSSSATVQGTYKIGGIAGTNLGTIENCKNKGTINALPVNLSTDIGGIAGQNKDTILSCTNNGSVGYQHTGYNVGGIAGLSQGFIRNCTNNAGVNGRRDVGGIVGQMEPSYRLEYGQNAMELLKQSGSEFSQALDTAIGDLKTAVQNGASGLSDVLTELNDFANQLSGDASALYANLNWVSDAKGYLESIRKEVQYIKDNLPFPQNTADTIADIEEILDRFDKEEPSAWPGLTDELAKKLTELFEKLDGYAWLGDSIQKITDAFKNLHTTVVTGIRQFGEDSTNLLTNAAEKLKKIRKDTAAYIESSKQDAAAVKESAEKAEAGLAALYESLNKVLAGKESSTEDISASIVNHADGMIVSCKNAGTVSGDYSTGGILGNLSKELSLDQETDPLPSADDVLFTDTTLFIRATVYDCENAEEVSAKYDYAGGIVGYGNRGAVLNGRNGGNVSAGRNYAGGIAGCHKGVIRDGYSIGLFSAERYAGGIAGEVKQAENCAAIPKISPDIGYVGAIAGKMTDAGKNNIFVGDTLGGVDNISYEGTAQKVTYEELLKQTGSPELFKTMQVRFYAEEELVDTVRLPYGEKLSELPAVEIKDNKYWKWDAFDKDAVTYNQKVSGEWRNFITTLASSKDDPLFLVEGVFDENAKLEVAERPDETALASYTLTVSECGEDTLTVRFKTENEGALYLLDGNEKKSVSYERDGKYIVFEMNNGGSFVLNEKAESSTLLFWILGGALLLLAIAVTVILCLSKKHGKKKTK